MREYVAERCMVANMEHIPLRSLPRDHIELKSFIDERTQSLVLSCDAYFYAAPKERIKVHRQWPADWWQAFKARWFPNWLLRRFPVRWDEVNIDRQLYGNVCPHLNEPTRSHLQFLSNDRPHSVSTR